MWQYEEQQHLNMFRRTVPGVGLRKFCLGMLPLLYGAVDAGTNATGYNRRFQ